jgi:N-acetylneuraminate synthase
MTANQRHPTHYHIKKEEAFELLSGDCVLVLDDKPIRLTKGKPVLIPRRVKHSFFSVKGCVIEEISTTHHVGDSIYDDVNINTLKVSDRKIKITLD